MTAFARQAGNCDAGQLVWELRSVNHRYLEPGFKLPEALRSLEPELRERLRGRLGRGKVECALRLQSRQAARGLQVDAELARSVIRAAEEIAAGISGPAPIDPLAILQWPGVIAEAADQDDLLHATAITAFEQALEQLVASRRQEGAELARLITQRLQQVEQTVTTVRADLPGILARQRERLQERLAAFRTELDPQRLEQEMALLAQKADVDEELDRLQTHVSEVRRVLQRGGPCGRRLDFLMQELNREANTLSSKSLTSSTTQAAVELKVLIEQMREQVQNIE